MKNNPCLFISRISISDWRLMLIRVEWSNGMLEILQMWMGCKHCRP